ncbi:MAG: helix-turn-helix domain-containing protein [Thermodesulfobacteriota bacterium]
MKSSEPLLNLGFSRYEITAYLYLVANHPVNGSQLSRTSAIPRAKIYDVLRSLKGKGAVTEVGEGQYAPLPPEELFGRLRHNFETSIEQLENKIKAATDTSRYDYVWTLKGHGLAIEKAQSMIKGARQEIYTRLFPQEGHALSASLQKAAERGIEIKYISMGMPADRFELQVVHPEAGKIEQHLGGRSFDLVVDREELLVGMFETGREEQAQVNWAKNHWFVVATRDSLRHDFFHYFLHKIYEKKQQLNSSEKKLYRLIDDDQ